MSENTENPRCLIIGSGPAGYTTAIYAARANLQPIMYEGLQSGGQLTTTTIIENFPGYPDGVTGSALMDDLRRQAVKFGTDVRFGVVTHVDFSKRPFKVTIDGRHILEPEAVIIATGATAKYLGLDSEEHYKGMGVSACATCDGFFYKNQEVIVVGGGDTACEEAIFLASICKKVYMVVRKDHLRASKIMQTHVKEQPNIEILYQYNTERVLGDRTGVTGALLRHVDGSEKIVDATGFFLAIGHHPNTEVFADYLELDELKYIVTKPGTSITNVPGVFAAGDVMNPSYRQAIVAAGWGCMAALDCERYLLSL